MGLLRRRAAEATEERDAASPQHGAYRIEVDSERHRFRDDGPTFSFWGSAKVVLILSVLLWWLPQSAGYMVAGYVGGRRAGSPWRAVLAALIPVIVIFGATVAYDNGYARGQIDFVVGLPGAVATGIGSAVPFLQPYVQFLVEYLTTFVLAIQKLFGMGSNGYMVTIVFAYIGGIVADQTRREIDAKGSEAGSAKVNIVQPIVERLHLGGRDPDAVRPIPADRLVEPSRAARRARAHPGSLADLHKVAAQVDARHPSRMEARRRPAEEDDEDEEEPARVSDRLEREPAPHRSRDEAAQMQRFVERALRNYDRSGHRRPRE